MLYIMSSAKIKNFANFHVGAKMVSRTENRKVLLLVQIKSCLCNYAPKAIKIENIVTSCMK